MVSHKILQFHRRVIGVHLGGCLTEDLCEEIIFGMAITIVAMARDGKGSYTYRTQSHG